MITPGLERVIQQGKARAHTFTFGAGAVGRIPCPDNSFLIIHHFDYFHFIDLPAPETDAPAIGSNEISGAGAVPPFPALFDFPLVGNFVANVDFFDPVGTLAGITALLGIIAPGWTVSLVILTATRWILTWTTTSPGEIWNGMIPTVTPTIPVPTFGDKPTPFAGGVDSVVTIAEFLRHSSHQLEFRSKKGRNHFVINEPVEIFAWQAVNGNPNSFFANCNGFYPKDCYLVHTEPVQINILGIPPVASWSIPTFLAPGAKSQEFPLGVGYGIAGTPSAPTVRQLFFDGAGLTQQYLPLTSQFENIAPVAGQYRDQFKVDSSLLNGLQNPLNTTGIQGNFKTYPLINIDYVQIDMNYNEFVKASNG